MTTVEIIAENKRRIQDKSSVYNPSTGEGCDETPRFRFEMKGFPCGEILFLPTAMKENLLIFKMCKYDNIDSFLKHLRSANKERDIAKIVKQFIGIRVKYDFPFWAFVFGTIKEKGTARDIQFTLNRPQRLLLKTLFSSWENNEPIRVIIVKARQWGGSTLIQVFMIWIQVVHQGQWNSVICAHLENTARVIMGMFEKLLNNYPTILGSEPLHFAPYQGSQKTKVVKPTGCRITIGSAEKPEGVRGDDTSMAHLSEVGLWASTAGKKPEDLAQTIHGGILDIPRTLIAYESTAKGVGNYFHREWNRAKNGESNFTPVFVPWFLHDKYTLPIKESEYEEFVQSLSKGEIELFNLGATLEGLKWYRNEKRNYKDFWRFVSEFPSTDVEAFQSTGSRVFGIDSVEKLRGNCRTPIAIGDIHGDDIKGSKALENLRFLENKEGCLKIWKKKEASDIIGRYVVIVDVGKGLTKKADNSIITVFDRYWMLYNGVPEVVAEWCGHIDMDVLAWKSIQIGMTYDNALVVIESNTLETNKVKGDNSEFILDEIADHYSNIYFRPQTNKVGFQTNTSTKKSAINELKGVLRGSDQYIEREELAVDEFNTYEVKESGSLGAVEGCRDDRVMTRAIGMWICYKGIEPPKIRESRNAKRAYRISSKNESTLM